MVNRLLERLEHRTGGADVLPGIDGVRAIAVSLVVAFHAHAYAGEPYVAPFGVFDLTPWLDSGYLGVDLFFVLSGFLLMLPWAKSHYNGRESPSVAQYFKRRIYRIVPAYYLHLAVLFLAVAPVVHSYGFLTSEDGYLNILAHLSFTQFFFPSTATGAGINGALWTLSIEAQFYLLLPFVARFFVGRRLWWGLLVALLISEIWRYISSHQLLDVTTQIISNNHSLFYDPSTATPDQYQPFLVQMFLSNQFPSQAFHFAIGMMTASLYMRTQLGGRSRDRMIGSGGSVLAMLSVSAFFYTAWLLAQFDLWFSYDRYIWYIFDALVCASLVWTASHPSLFSRKVLGNFLVRLIGLTSYSVYLWHVPICFFVQRYLTPSYAEAGTAFYYLVAVGGLLSLMVGCLSYFFVERPFLCRRAPRACTA